MYGYWVYLGNSAKLYTNTHQGRLRCMLQLFDGFEAVGLWSSSWLC